MTPEQAWKAALEAGRYTDVYGRIWTRDKLVDMWFNANEGDPQQGLYRGSGFMQRAVLFEAGDR